MYEFSSGFLELKFLNTRFIETVYDLNTINSLHKS